MGSASLRDIEDGALEPDDPDFMDKRMTLDRRLALYRIKHISWQEEELPGNEEYAEANKNLDAHNRKVDYIIPHCAPTSIADVISRGIYQPAALTDYLETVYQACKFKKW